MKELELIYTNQDYGNQIKQANQAISDLSVYEFEKYFKQLKKIKRVATLKSHRAAVIHGLKTTHKKGLIESEKFLELMEFLKEFKTGKVALGIQEQNILTPAEIDLLIEGVEIMNQRTKKLIEVPTLQIKQIIKLLSKTGLRISELLTIRQSDIKLIKGVYNLSVRGKGNKERIVYLDNETYKETDKLFAGKFYLCDFGTGKEYSEVEQEKHYKFVYTSIKKACRHILGRSDIHPHSFRHYVANDLLNKKKLDLKAVSQYLGHESVETTTKFYQQSKLKPGDIFGEK